MIYTGIDESGNLAHFGNKNSGRYKRGSGDRPWQHEPGHSVGNAIRDKVVETSKEKANKLKNDWNDPEKRKQIIRNGAVATATVLAAVGTYKLAKNELRMVPQTVITNEWRMPIYGPGGKMLFPPRSVPVTHQIMVPNYVAQRT